MHLLLPGYSQPNFDNCKQIITLSDISCCITSTGLYQYGRQLS